MLWIYIKTSNYFALKSNFCVFVFLMIPNSAYYNISFEKGAYSFGPANTGAKSYYKELNENKLTKGDEFCGSDKKN